MKAKEFGFEQIGYSKEEKFFSYRKIGNTYISIGTRCLMVISEACNHGDMLKEILSACDAEVFTDKGLVRVNTVIDQVGYDWSFIRDSSDDAHDKMLEIACRNEYCNNLNKFLLAMETAE